MGRSRFRKIKSVNTQQPQEAGDVFYMTLDEVRASLADKYEPWAERIEQKYPKHKGLA